MAVDVGRATPAATRVPSRDEPNHRGFKQKWAPLPDNRIRNLAHQRLRDGTRASSRRPSRDRGRTAPLPMGLEFSIGRLNQAVLLAGENRFRESAWRIAS